MADQQLRIPRIGDRVIALGQNGTFVVLRADEDTMSADLKLLSPKECVLKNIPWRLLRFLKTEGVNQTAAQSRPEKDKH